MHFEHNFFFNFWKCGKWPGLDFPHFFLTGPLRGLEVKGGEQMFHFISKEGIFGIFYKSFNIPFLCELIGQGHINF